VIMTAARFGLVSAESRVAVDVIRGACDGEEGRRRCALRLLLGCKWRSPQRNSI
jgi:hypothetical protein